MSFLAQTACRLGSDEETTCRLARLQPLEWQVCGRWSSALQTARGTSEWAETDGVGIISTRRTCWYIEQPKKDNGGLNSLRKTIVERKIATLEWKTRKKKKNSNTNLKTMRKYVVLDDYQWCMRHLFIQLRIQQK